MSPGRLSSTDGLNASNGRSASVGARGERDAEGYRRLVLYLEECGLYDELWAIAERHELSLHVEDAAPGARFVLQPEVRDD